MTAEDMANQGANMSQRAEDLYPPTLDMAVSKRVFYSTSVSRLQIIAPCQTWAKPFFLEMVMFTMMSDGKFKTITEK